MVVALTIPKTRVKRLMVASGAERVTKESVEEMLTLVENFINEKTKMAIKMSAHAGRRTITLADLKAIEGL